MQHVKKSPVLDFIFTISTYAELRAQQQERNELVERVAAREERNQAPPAPAPADLPAPSTPPGPSARPPSALERRVAVMEATHLSRGDVEEIFRTMFAAYREDVEEICHTMFAAYMAGPAHVQPPVLPSGSSSPSVYTTPPPPPPPVSTPPPPPHVSPPPPPPHVSPPPPPPHVPSDQGEIRSFLVAREPLFELPEHLSPRRLTYSEAEVAGQVSGGGAGDAPPIGEGAEGAGDVQGEIRSFLVARAPESVLPEHLSPRRLTYSEAEVAGLVSGGECFGEGGSAPLGEGGVPRGRGNAPVGEGGVPRGRGNAPVGEGGVPRGRGNAPVGEGGVPRDRGNAPVGEGGVPRDRRDAPLGGIGGIPRGRYRGHPSWYWGCPRGCSLGGLGGWHRWWSRNHQRCHCFGWGGKGGWEGREGGSRVPISEAQRIALKGKRKAEDQSMPPRGKRPRGGEWVVFGLCHMTSCCVCCPLPPSPLIGIHLHTYSTLHVSSSPFFYSLRRPGGRALWAWPTQKCLPKLWSRLSPPSHSGRR